jgi:hypothetical protein
MNDMQDVNAMIEDWKAKFDRAHSAYQALCEAENRGEGWDADAAEGYDDEMLCLAHYASRIFAAMKGD